MHVSGGLRQTAGCWLSAFAKASAFAEATADKRRPLLEKEDINYA